MTQEINDMGLMGRVAGETEEPSVSAALTVAKDVDSQKAARARRLSASLGLPENLALENPWAAEAEKKAADIGSNKLLKAWAVQDKINAALARDDTEALLDVANTVSASGNRALDNSENFWASGHWAGKSDLPPADENGSAAALGRAWEQGVYQVDLSDLGQRYRAGDDSVLPLIERTQKSLNPYPWQDSYGILKPGAEPSGAGVYVYEDGGRAVLLPGAGEDGAGLSREDAVERFLETGEHAGIFANTGSAFSFLNLPAEKRKELYSTFQEKPVETVADKIFLTAAAEQLPRMIYRQLPEQGWTALAAGTGGALSAAALGQFGPQVLLPEELLTVPAAFAVTARAGWLAGTYTSAFKAEMGSFIAELALEKDANGQPIPRDVQNAAADVYGLLSATVETAGEAVFLKLLGPLGLGNAAGRIGEQGAKVFLRSAVRRAALDQSARAALLAAGGRVAAGAATEGAQEGVQEALSILVEVFSKDIANAAGLDFGEQEVFTAENAERVKEAAKGGFQAGIWLSGAPIVVKGAIDARNAVEARRFSERHIALHEKVEATSTKQLSPESMQRALESFDPSLGADVSMPADAMLEYYQTGIDLATALGITEEDLMHHAQMGHSFKVPVSRMHSYYDQQQFEAAARIMRQTDDLFSYADAENIDAYTEEDAELIAQYFDQGIKEYTAFELERGRVRSGAIQAIQNNEGLKTQAESLAGGVEAYVDTWLGTVEGFARRLSSQGIPMEETFRRIVFGGKRNAGQSEYVSGMSEAEYAEWIGNRVERQAARDWAESDMNPVKRLRGRIDGASLKTDWPEAYREITRNYGVSFFKSKKNGGLPVDYFVSELEEAGVVPQGAGADDIVELLKSRPDEYFQDSVLAEQALQRDVAAWGQSVESFLANKLPRRQLVTMLNQTPLVLQMLGAKNLPVKTTYGTLGKVLQDKHKLPPETLKQVPAAMADPVMVFKSATQAGDMVMMLELKDQHGATVIVPVALEQDIPGNYTVNLATSVYGQKNTETKKPRNQWFAHQIESGNLLYQNKKKSRAWSAMVGLQLPPMRPPRSAENKIYTDADLVKLREANTTLYQNSNAPLGSTQITDEAEIIRLFENANLSTLLHETGHVFLNEIKLAVESGMADENLQRDYGIITNWLGVTGEGDFTRQQHEQFARGFEAYLMEGKAPTTELEGAFRRFKHWLTKVYQSVKNLGVTLNEDIRGVFDRMVAVEQDIAATAARNELLDLTEKELDALGLTGQARLYASKLMETAREIAADNMQQDLDQNRKQRLAKYAREAAEDLAAGKIYSARSDLRKTPLDIDLVKDDYGTELARVIMRKVPGSLKAGGVDPEIFAAEHGFYSGAEMLGQIAESPSKAEAVKALAQQKEQEHDSAYEAFEYLLDTVQVERRMELVGRKLAEQLNARSIEQTAFYSVAERELMNMPMGRATQTGNFLAAMRRELRKERRAIAAGDISAALEANHKSRLNMEFARQSRKLAKEQGAVERRINRFVKSAKTDPDARFIVMDIGIRHGLCKLQKALAGGRERSVVTAWLKGAEADGYTIYADDNVLIGPGLPWREMSTADFAALAETVNQIVTVERNRRQVASAQGKQDLEEVADSISASIYKRRSPKLQKTVEADPKVKTALRGAHALHTKIEALCVALDGDTTGAMWESIYRPISQADDTQARRFKQVTKDLRGADLFGAFSRKEMSEMGRKKEYIPEIGERMTRVNRIAVALNMGNEANLSRVKEGHNWNDAQIQAVVSALTARDWKFVQSVWNYLDTFKEESFRLQEEISGMRPVAVEPAPLTVQTADGQMLNLAGGYYPIRYNSEKGFKAYQQSAAEMDKELFGGRNYGAAYTKTGHLKARAEGGLGTPLLLELDVITDHVFNVVHDLSFRRAVLDVAKVIRHKKVREAIESTVGREMYKELMPWLQDVANERQEPMHYIHRLARWARASSSIMTMGFKFTTMFTQPLGFTQSVDVLGYKYAGAGLKTAYGNPLKLPELLEKTYARSAFMESRIKSFDREVRDYGKKLNGKTGRFAWVDFVKENAFAPMGWFQMSVDLPTWWGGYAKGLADFKGDEVKAAEYADSIVRQSQGSGSAKDLARVQRGGELQRLLTMYYSYFNTLYQLGARGVTRLKNNMTPQGIFEAANTALLLWFVPAVLSELVAGRGPDDDEEALEWAAMNMLQYPFQTVVGVRDVSNYVFGEFGYELSPAAAAPKSLGKWFKTVRKAIEEEDPDILVKPTAEAAGYLFGLPMKQPIITVGNLWDYLTGEDPEFEVRDLFFVKPKDRR